MSDLVGKCEDRLTRDLTNIYKLQHVDISPTPTMDFQVKWRVFGFIVFGLILWQTGWLVEADSTGAGGMESE